MLKALGHGEKGFTLIELLVVVVILGILAAVIVPNVGKFMNEGREEAKQIEHHNIQTAILSLLAYAEVHQLDQAYSDVQERTEVEAVKATVDSTEYTLDDYLMGGQYPLLQSYDILPNGIVDVHPE